MALFRLESLGCFLVVSLWSLTYAVSYLAPQGLGDIRSGDFGLRDRGRGVDLAMPCLGSVGVSLVFCDDCFCRAGLCPGS